MAGKRLWYPGCPARHLDPRVGGWIESYHWLSKFGKTPVELGLLAADEMDPRWYEAVMLIEGEIARLQQEREERQAMDAARAGRI